MPKLEVKQLRSGEGWILTEASNVSVDVLSKELADLVEGVLLVASDDFERSPPQGGEQVAPGLFAFRGAAARTMLANASSWTRDRALFGIVPRVPDADARRKWIPDPMRPWDAERILASVYGQAGRRLASRGLWFAEERDRARLVTVVVERALAASGCRLPNGDASLVLEMPTDSTFEATFDVRGRGESVALEREFPSHGVSRRWTVHRGEWQAVEKRSGRSEERRFRDRATQGLASAAIFVMSIPVFTMVALLALATKLTSTSAAVSRSAPPAADE